MATMTFTKSNPFVLSNKKPINPAFKDKEFESDVLKVRRYFQQILYAQSTDNFMKFPSLKAISGFLKVSVQEIKNALEELKHMGFDYEIVHAKDAILVWDRFLAC